MDAPGDNLDQLQRVVNQQAIVIDQLSARVKEAEQCIQRLFDMELIRQRNMQEYPARRR